MNTAGLEQSVEGLVFEFQERQTQGVNTGSDSSTAKRSATGVNVTSPVDETIKTEVICHSRCGALKKTRCSLAVSAEHQS